MSELRLSMVMIARDEQEYVRACFDSFWDHVDEVVLCDTGSSDDTVGEAQRFAAARSESEKLIVGHFEWCDDFAAARNHAHSLATGDIHARIDVDEIVINAEAFDFNLRKFASDPALMALEAPIENDDQPLSRVIRPQIFRAPVRWAGRTWEGVEVFRGFTALAEEVRWEHTRHSHRSRRDVDIALHWAAVAETATERLRALYAAICESSALGAYAETVAVCEEALNIERDPAGRSTLLAAKAFSLWMLEDSAAEQVAREAVRLAPESSSTASSRILLARAAAKRNEWEAALEHVRSVRPTDTASLVSACSIGIDAAEALGRFEDGAELAEVAAGSLRDSPERDRILRRAEVCRLEAGQVRRLAALSDAETELRKLERERAELEELASAFDPKRRLLQTLLSSRS